MISRQITRIINCNSREEHRAEKEIPFEVFQERFSNVVSAYRKNDDIYFKIQNHIWNTISHIREQVEQLEDWEDSCVIDLDIKEFPMPELLQDAIRYGALKIKCTIDKFKGESSYWDVQKHDQEWWVTFDYGFHEEVWQELNF